MRSADPKAEGRHAPRQRRLRKGYGRFLLLPDTPSNFPMSWRMGPSDARLTTPQRRRGWRSSPPQPGPKCKLGLECLALPLRATFPGDPAPQESHPDVLWGVASQPQQSSRDLGSHTQVSHLPDRTLGSPSLVGLIHGLSRSREADLPFEGGQGDVGAAGGSDAQPPRVWVSVETPSETAAPAEAPRSPQSGTNSGSGRCRPECLRAPRSPPHGWLASPFHQGPSATTGSEIHGQVQTPRRLTRTCVCILRWLLYLRLSPQRKQFQRGPSWLARVPGG